MYLNNKFTDPVCHSLSGILPCGWYVVDNKFTPNTGRPQTQYLVLDVLSLVGILHNISHFFVLLFWIVNWMSIIIPGQWNLTREMFFWQSSTFFPTSSFHHHLSTERSFVSIVSIRKILHWPTSSFVKFGDRVIQKEIARSY